MIYDVQQHLIILQVMENVWFVIRTCDRALSSGSATNVTTARIREGVSFVEVLVFLMLITARNVLSLRKMLVFKTYYLFLCLVINGGILWIINLILPTHLSEVVKTNIIHVLSKLKSSLSFSSFWTQTKIILIKCFFITSCNIYVSEGWMSKDCESRKCQDWSILWKEKIWI